MSKSKTPKVKNAPTSNKNIRAKHSPIEQEIKIKSQPSDETDTHNPAWQFHKWDKEHELWGWNKLSLEEILDVLEHLANFEGMSWQKIKEQSGGRRSGTNSHSLPLSSFSKGAKKRIQELKLDEFDDLFSLRLNSTVRLYGIRTGKVLRLVWHDPYHGQDKGAYPVSQR